MMPTPRMLRRFLLVILTLSSVGCSRSEVSPASASRGGDQRHGQSLITQYGCVNCHVIPGIAGPPSSIAPSLEHMALRPTVAGRLRNNPETITRWLQNPQGVNPESDMPNLGV